MNCCPSNNISFINDPAKYYSNKLIKMNTKCVSYNLTDAENTINNAYKYLSLIHEYLQQIKEELDSLFKSDIPYCKFLSILKIINIYVKEIDYTISQAVYNDKYLIISPTDEQTEIKFSFSTPYNFKINYPIGVPIGSAKNDYIFSYKCPVITSEVLELDIVLSDLIIKKYTIDVSLINIPEKNTLVRIGRGVGIFIEQNEQNQNIWTIDVFYNHDSIIENENITDLKKETTHGIITTINNNEDILDYDTYPNLSEIVCYLQFITDTGLDKVWNDIDKISYYLFVCDINNKLQKSFCKRIV